MGRGWRIDPWEKGRRISIPSRSASNLVAVRLVLRLIDPASARASSQPPAPLGVDPLQPPGAETGTEVSIPCSLVSRRARRERAPAPLLPPPLRARAPSSTPDQTRLTYSNSKPKPNQPNSILTQLPSNRNSPKKETKLYTPDLTQTVIRLSDDPRALHSWATRPGSSALRIYQARTHRDAHAAVGPGLNA